MPLKSGVFREKKRLHHFVLDSLLALFGIDSTISIINNNKKKRSFPMIFDSFLRPLKEVSHRNYYRSRSAVCPRSLLVKARTPANQEPPGQAGGRSLGRIFFFLTNKYNHSLFKPIRERTKFHNRRWTYRSRWSRKKK